jgi:hypothetical protein
MKEKQPSDSLSRIRDSLKILKLNEINRVLDDELAQSVQESSPPTDLLERLFTLEANALIQRRTGSCSQILILYSRKAWTRPGSWN